MLLQGQLLEQLLFPISCSFWVLSLSLIFCRGTAVYITGAFKRIYLKHQTFGKAVHVFQNITCSRTFLKLVCHFFWKEELRPAILSFKRTGFYLRISVSHPFFRVECFFSQSSCSHIFFQGCSIYSIDIMQPSILSGAIWNR